jgi:hypothetical protein
VPWVPPEPGDVPTLGYEVIDWVADMLAAPDRGEYEPFILYPEQEDFVLRFYELDPRTGKRRRRRGVISRPRGWGKSPFLAALAIAEALGPVVPDGWDADGQPVGKPWAEVRTPLVQIAAVSETQTKNTWTPLLEMLQGPVIDEYPGLEPLDTFVNLPRGRIEPITSSARTVKGNKPVFAVLDQTEEWVKGNGGIRLAEVMRINAAKIGGSTIESPNAYTPGEDSVAEHSAAFWGAIKDGRAKDDGLYFDHREAPGNTDLEDEQSLMKGLTIAYGDAADANDGHVDLRNIMRTINDPDIDVQTARADFLNQITHASDAYISQPQWAACVDAMKVVADRDAVVLGFDGSRGRARGKPDATALIGCRVSDAHMFQVAVWEADDKPGQWESWEAPMVEIEAAIASAFQRYNVVGFYCDPAKDWRSHVNAWEAKYAGKVKVKATRDHPFEWWMTGGRSGLIQRAVEQFEGAVRNQDMTHDGSWALTRHMLNARRRVRHGKLGIGKESDHSPRKIDAAVAAVLAWQARLDAVAAGVGQSTTFVPQRIR